MFDKKYVIFFKYSLFLAFKHYFKIPRTVFTQ